MAEPIRVLISKPGIDGHWRGALVVASALREAGMEVVFGGHQTPEEIAETALQEDVDVVGLSILAPGYRELVSRTLKALQERGVRALVLVGGTILPEDIPTLEAMGVDRVFLPGTPLEEIVEHLRRRAQEGAFAR